LPYPEQVDLRHPRLQALPDEGGQSAVEYLGMLLAVAAILGVVIGAAPELGRQSVDGVRDQIDRPRAVTPPGGWRGADRESRQVLPILIVGMCFVLLVGFLLYTVGAAARLKTEGQTAADAAALAGEENVKHQLLRLISTGAITPENINWVEVAARDDAKRNDGTVTDFQHLLFDVWVTVRSDRGLDGGEVARDDARAISKARASLGATYAISAALGGAPVGGAAVAVAGGGGGAGGPNPIPEVELKEIEKAAGVKLRGDSALRRYAGPGNGDGPNVAQLSTSMKVSIAKAEELMGAPLIITSACRSAAYQAVICAQAGQGGRCAPPSQSQHNFGLAIDVANYPPRWLRRSGSASRSRRPATTTCTSRPPPAGSAAAGAGPWARARRSGAIRWAS